MEQRVIVITYYGNEIDGAEATAFAKNLCKKATTGPVSICTLNEREIANAIVGVHTKLKSETSKTEIEYAAMYIHKTYKEDFAAGNLDNFVRDSLNSALIVKNDGPADRLYIAIRLLATNDVSDKMRTKYKLTKKVMEVIKSTYAVSTLK